MDSKLLILIERERSSGCYDMAVFGGFGSFVAELGDETLTRLGRQYGDSPRAARPQLLAQMEARVREMLTAEAASAADNAPDENALDRNAPNRNAPNRNALDGNAPNRNALDGNAPDRNAPNRNAPDGNAPDRNALDSADAARAETSAGAAARTGASAGTAARADASAGAAARTGASAGMAARTGASAGTAARAETSAGAAARAETSAGTAARTGASAGTAARAETSAGAAARTGASAETAAQTGASAGTAAQSAQLMRSAQAAASEATAKPTGSHAAAKSAKSAAKAAASPAAPTSLDLPLTSLPHVGAKRAEALARLGLHTVGELLERPPRTYRDRSTVTPIEALSAGDTANIRGVIRHTGLVRTRRGFTLLTCQVEDESAALPLIWFNQPFLEKQLRPGRSITAYGRLERRWDKLSFLVQDFQLEGTTESGIVPVYDLTAGLSNKQMQALVAAAWQRCGEYIADLLPEALRQKRGLPCRRELLRSLHFPRSLTELEPARQALAYEELLVLSLALLTRQQTDTGSVRRPALDNEQLKSEFSGQLPFSLTRAQSRVIDAIYADLDRPRPMARLVQGDVGSGKTMVAAAAILKCARQGRQAALMAPTEILARQHYENLAPLFDRLHLTSALLTGSTPAARRRDVLSWLAQGQLDVLIGTHALIQSGVEFYDLGLAVTDEQHRFGVAQRASLSALRAGRDAADVLVMTATPIPRTLALTIYGDLDLSIIDELPPGRTPVQTFAVDYSYERRIHAFVEQQVAEGGQAFIVCPLIDENDESELASATEVYNRLSNEVFPDRRLALLHGRMKPTEKDEVMAAFRSGETDILVSTTVIEVGIDVPNACVMLVRDAERFGLAQLHQLRGRIGRGQRPGFCLLLHNAKTDIARQRMRIICQTTSGYALAEADLRLRGPGEVFGDRQSGLPELQAADILRDAELLTEAHADAAELLASGPLDPALAERAQTLAARLN